MKTKERLSAEQELLEKLQEHKGEWVAIRGADIVAAAPTREALREQVSLREIDAYFEVTPDETAVQVF
jgi:hypothetical protein